MIAYVGCRYVNVVYCSSVVSFVSFPFGAFVGQLVDCQLMLFSVAPEFNLSATLVNSQLVCLPPVGILSQVMFI